MGEPAQDGTQRTLRCRDGYDKRSPRGRQATRDAPHADSRMPIVTDFPGAMIREVGAFQCVVSVMLVRTVCPPSPQLGHGDFGSGQMPVLLSCSAIQRNGHCLFSTHSSAHALDSVTHSQPPPPNSRIGRQASRPESPPARGVAIMHCSSTTTRTHSTQPWSPPMCASFDT